jgi:hypothetical protein
VPPYCFRCGVERDPRPPLTSGLGAIVQEARDKAGLGPATLVDGED